MAFVAEDPDLVSDALDTLVSPNYYDNESRDLNVAIENMKRGNMLGLLTIEDVIEVLITENVYDEADLKRSSGDGSSLLGWHRKGSKLNTFGSSGYVPPRFGLLVNQ